MQGVVKSADTGRIAFATRENPMCSGKGAWFQKMFSGSSWSRFPLAKLSTRQSAHNVALIQASLGDELELNH